MDTAVAQAELSKIDQEMSTNGDEVVQRNYVKLLNIIEQYDGENNKLKEDNQKLTDENNRLKGEQGKPDIKASKKPKDISSEDERKKAEAAAAAAVSGKAEPELNAQGKIPRHREPKIPKIHIDRKQDCPLDKTGLPDDLVFQGYVESVVQDLIIRTDNVLYRRENYYSPSQKKYYLGALPPEVDGEFGAGIRALIPIFKTECRMSEKRIHSFLTSAGIYISPTYISQQWTNGYEIFLDEKKAIYRSGLSHSPYAQTDDTGARVNGSNQYCQIVCSPLFSAYFTTPGKDRLTILSVLTNFAPPQYVYNQEAAVILNDFNLSKKTRKIVDEHLPVDVVMGQKEFTAKLDGIKVNYKVGPQQMTRLAEACAIAYYHQQQDFPIVSILMSDDAPQFKQLTAEQILCWVHDGRHYKKLTPFVPLHQQRLDDFRGRYWDYYTELLKYQLDPTDAKKISLSDAFDVLFTTVTGYDDLDARIAKTLAKKTELLLVLKYPWLPLHNNDAELAAREQARVRDVSFQTRSEKGTQIKDAMMTIRQTAIKLGVNFYDYVRDRVSNKMKMTSLAELIAQKSQTMGA